MAGDSIFRTGLGRAAANFAALTPLGFLPRAASIYPDRLAIIHGDRRIRYREFDARARRLASALAAARYRAGRHRVGSPAERAGDARRALRRADDRGRAQHHQHAARRAHDRLHPGARRGEGAADRSGVRRNGRARARTAGPQAPGDRGGRRALRGPGGSARRDRVRGVPGDGIATTTPGRRPRTRARRSRSTTPRERPATPRASSTITAARSWNPSATS